MSRDDGDVTGMLVAWGQGDRAADSRLIAVVYQDLRRVARRRLRAERADHSLAPTALVHEAYLRLVDLRRVRWQNRAQFFAIAARLMRQILVDHARAHVAAKRGGSTGLGEESADGQTVLYQTQDDDAPLLAMPLAGGPARQVVKCVRGGGNFDSGPQGLYYLACGPGLDAAVHLRYPDGRDELLGTLEKSTSGLAVSPDGTTILYTKKVRDGADLMMIENFR